MYQDGRNKFHFYKYFSPLLLTCFFISFVIGNCVGLKKSGNQTPWAAIGLGLNANTPNFGDSGTTGIGTPGVGGSGSGSAGAGAPVLGMFFFHNDQVGSVKTITGANGEMITGSNGASRIVYGAYGDIDMNHSQGPDVLNKKFTGQTLDNESGLYYYNARYYDPALGRFITADSIVDAGGSASGMNPYMYVSGNPISSNDPSGHIKSADLKKRIIQDVTSAVLQDFAGKSESNQALTYLYLNHQKQQSEKKATRQEITHGIITLVVFTLALVLSIVFINPAIGMAASSLAGAVTGVTSGFLFTVVQLTASIAFGTAAGMALGAAGAGLGGAMATGFNGRKDAKAGRAIGEGAAGAGNFAAGFFEGTEVKADEDVITKRAEKRQLVNGKGQALFRDGVADSKGVLRNGIPQMGSYDTFSYTKASPTFHFSDFRSSPLNIKSFSHLAPTENWYENPIVKDIFLGNVGQDRLTNSIAGED